MSQVFICVSTSFGQVCKKMSSVQAELTRSVAIAVNPNGLIVARLFTTQRSIVAKVQLEQWVNRESQFDTRYVQCSIHTYDKFEVVPDRGSATLRRIELALKRLQPSEVTLQRLLSEAEIPEYVFQRYFDECKLLGLISATPQREIYLVKGAA
jgi:hypothetical protein